jgi:hypothetical protein
MCVCLAVSAMSICSALAQLPTLTHLPQRRKTLVHTCLQPLGQKVASTLAPAAAAVDAIAGVSADWSQDTNDASRANQSAGTTHAPVLRVFF